MKIVRFEARHLGAVKRLNLRLAAAGEPWHFPERPESLWLPDTPGESIVEHYYVAEDGDEVRGGYILKWQPFWIEGRSETVCTLYLPLSEGIINQAFRLLGLTLIRDALARHPLAFCLGMGGAARALPQTLKMLGWQVHDLPFFFLPLRPVDLRIAMPVHIFLKVWGSGSCCSTGCSCCGYRNGSSRHCCSSCRCAEHVPGQLIVHTN